MASIMDIGCNMINVDKYIRLFLKKKLSSYDLNATEGIVFLLLFKQELKLGITSGVTQERIMQDLQYDKGVITRTMQSLEQKDYIVRYQNPSDGRSSIFVLSEKAKGISDDIEIIIEQLSIEILKGISPEKTEELSMLIQKLSDNAWDYYNKL